MKLSVQIKFILLMTLALMYLTGVVTWVMQNWLLVSTGFGLEPSPFRVWWLQMHSILGLWFMLVFGYLWSVHLQPAWKKRKKLKSGFALTVFCVVLIMTVPGLFYISHDSWRDSVIFVHTYVGLIALLPFAVHYFTLP